MAELGPVLKPSVLGLNDEAGGRIAFGTVANGGRDVSRSGYDCQG